MSSSKRNDNESTDTSKGPGKKKVSTEKDSENAKLKYSAPSEEKIKQAWFSSASPEKDKGERDTEWKTDHK